MGGACSSGKLEMQSVTEDLRTSSDDPLLNSKSREWLGPDSVKKWEPEGETMWPIHPFKHTYKRELNVKEEGMSRSRTKAVALTIVKWGLPMFFTGFLTFLCMVYLHIGTYYYVQHMHLLTSLFDRNHANITQFHSGQLSMGWSDTSTQLVDSSGRAKALSYGSLNDEFHKLFGFAQVNIGVLDMIAAAFPMLFVVMAVGMDELAVWTKVMLCNGILALSKGLFGMMTTVPDSKGWVECKNRLGPDGLAWMMDYHADPLFSMEFYQMELFGLNGKRLRWCADMMFSGHTYFTTLYALGLYELTFYFTREWKQSWRLLALGSVICVAIIEQVVEVYFVLLNRFHYSMDVVMAILLTFLFFTNPAIVTLSKRWVWAGIKRKKHTWTKDMAEKVYKARKDLEEKLGNLAGSAPQEDGEFHDNRVTIIPTKELMSNGDVFIPCCMNPFGMCLGNKANAFGSVRHHIFDDHDLGDMLFASTKEDQEAMCDHMRLSMRDNIMNNPSFRKLHGLEP